MKRRFIIGVNSMSPQQEQRFVSYIRSKGLGWWHWIKSFWLIVDVSGQMTVTELRDTVNSIAPGERNLVIEIEGSGTWAGFGPSADSKDMSFWLRETWS